MLKNQMYWHSEHSFLLQQCKAIIKWKGWEVKISHYFREANQGADILVNMNITER